MWHKLIKVVDKITTFFLDRKDPQISIPFLTGRNCYCSIHLREDLSIDSICFERNFNLLFLKTEVGKEVLEDGIYYYTIAIEKYPGENVKAVEIFSPKRIAMHGPNLEELKEYVRFNLVCLEGVKHE